jgi:acyl carrier protein
MPNDLRITDALADAGIDYDIGGYDPQKSFRENGIDSLDVMSLFLAVEERYGVKFSEEEASAIKTPIGISAALDRKLNR